MWQDSAAYGAPSSSQNSYYGRGNQPNVPLQFYDQSSFYVGSRSSLEGNVNAAQGTIVTPGASGYTGSIQPAGRWWTAFGTGGFEGEPPLLEGESGSASIWLRFLTCAYYRARHQLLSHTSQVHDGSKSLSPRRRAHNGRRRPRRAPHLLFLLRHVSPFRTCGFACSLTHGAPHPLTNMCVVRQATVRVYLWPRAIRLHQPLLSPKPDVRARYRCLPRALCARLLLATHGWRWRTQRCYHVGVRKHTCWRPPYSDVLLHSGMLGYMLSSLSIVWCTYAASGIFVAVLRMSDQRLLVAYPVGLLYGCFALLSVFNVGGSK